MVRFLMACAAVVLMSGAAMADRLKGKEAAALLAAGPLQFQAGSVATFKPDGTFDFQHANAAETGTFKISPNGNVEIRDAATKKKSKFYFDRKANGTTVVYTSGPNKGRRYPLK